MSAPLHATAVAHSNIALVKYWGKLARAGNYPAVPSLSLTLDAFSTRTEVCFDAQLKSDEFALDGTLVTGRPLERVTRLLSSVRMQAKLEIHARVISVNNFPTASGLASSASGFAALAVAASHAAGLSPSAAEQSALARSCSASAARSLFGGLAMLNVGSDAASPLLGAQEWPLALIVAVTDASPKSIGSTEAMNHCSKTSPCYRAWLDAAPALFASACAAVLRQDLESLGACMEESTWLMHSTMITANPAVLYLAPATLSVIHELRRRRCPEIPAFFTTDAGAHVKVLTLAKHAETVKNWLSAVTGVTRVVVCHPGPPAYLVDPQVRAS